MKTQAVSPRRQRRPLAILMIVVAITVRADPVTVPVADPAMLAQQAEQRARQYPLLEMPPPAAFDAETVKRLADVGRQRGQQQFAQFMQSPSVTQASTPGVKPGAGQAAATASAVSHMAPQPGLVVVALSSSMPTQTLRQYFAQLDGHREAVVVLRGFIGGAHAVKPTGRWLEVLLRRHSDCADCGHYRVNVTVDPLAYSGLGIQQVPAVAYLPGVTQLQHCHHQQFRQAGLVYGAASIEYALRSARKSGAAIPDAILQGFGASG